MLPTKNVIWVQMWEMFFKIIFGNLVILSPKKREYCKRIFFFVFCILMKFCPPVKKNRCAREKIKDSSLMEWYTFTRKCNILTHAHCKQVLGSYTMFSKTKSVVPIFWKFKDKATCNSVFKRRCVLTPESSPKVKGKAQGYNKGLGASPPVLSMSLRIIKLNV